MFRLMVMLVILTTFRVQCNHKRVHSTTFIPTSSLRRSQFEQLSSNHILISRSIFRDIQATPDTSLRRSSSAVGYSGRAPPIPYPDYYAATLRQNFEIEPQGNYRHSYETDNGISVQEQGDIRQLGVDKNQVLDVSGSYSYTAPDGTLIELSYIANENGFQPKGAHLPTPPPIPKAIQRALDYIKNHPYVDNNKKYF